jgi:ribose transport system ATP-binding protein
VTSDAQEDVGVGLGHSGRAQRAADLQLQTVSKSYGGVHALRAVNLEAVAGEVHGLVGENGAGKSTLVKILSGAVAPDDGTIILDGQPRTLGTPALSREIGIATAYQELSLVLDWDVATNLFYGREPAVRAGRISPRAARAAARKVLADLGVTSIDPGRVVRDLRLAERQVLEIVHALIADPRVLILDEPTSALTAEQVEWFTLRVREFVSRDRLVLFISHRLDEIAAMCDRLTVLRDGRDVACGPITEMSEGRIVELMLGERHQLELAAPHERRPKLASRTSGVTLQEFASPPELREVTLDIGAGEVVGVAGLEGQGQLELFLALYGVRRSTGAVELDGNRLKLRSPTAAKRYGIGLVPEDRSLALCLPLSIRDNLTLGSFETVSRFGMVSRGRETAMVTRVMTNLHVRAQSGGQVVETLSGGNQQKVLLGRVLEANPRLLLLYDATRGVDVGTKAEIFALMHAQADAGVAVLYYSTDATELLTNCDRVIVMHDGAIRATLAGEALTHEGIISAAVGGGAHG